MIKVTNLNKYYNKGRKNEYHVINNFSFEFEDKGLYSIFGPSGCGKTTFLNVIGGLDTFDSGTIDLFGNIIDHYNSSQADLFRNKYIGFIFQNYNLVDSMTVLQNVELVLDMIGIESKEEKDKRIKEVLTAVGLFKYRKRNVLALSGGQRQRVAIARALAKNPKVILADEPTGNLDSNNTFEVMNIIKKISKDRLVILVSHEKNLVDFYSDKILEFKDGSLVDVITNDGQATLNHKDVRNIYLKDYQKEQDNNGIINSNIYYDKKPKDLKFDIIYKNDEIYIKSYCANKIHFIDENSEIKLLDSSEKEFIESIRNDSAADFSFDNFSGETNNNKKGYLSIGKCIKDSFKNPTRYMKRGVVGKILLYIVSITFAFLLCSFSAKFYFTEKNYRSLPDSVVSVELTKKDEKNELDYYSLVEDAIKVDGFVSISPSITENPAYLGIQANGFYQINQTIRTPIYQSMIVDSSSVIMGQNTISDGQIIVSTWVLDDILSNSNAKLSALSEYSQFLNMDVFVSYEYYSDNLCSLKIVGICDVPAKLVYITENNYATVPAYTTTYLIETHDKQKMIEQLSSKYQKVYDPNENVKAKYIKNIFKTNKASLIFSGVLLASTFVYLALMIRSSMFKKIKEIGVLRTIGATKKDIRHIYTGEMIALTSKTSFIGFSITFLIILYFTKNYSLASLGIKVMNPSLPTYLIGLIVLYGINLLSSILPIRGLLIKTPVEIIKKYDI